VDLLEDLEILLPYLLRKEIMVVMEIVVEHKNLVAAEAVPVVLELPDLILE
jgi:hypothetical protein